MKQSQSVLRVFSATMFSLALIQAAPLYAKHKHAHHYKGHCVIKQIDSIKDALNLSPEQESSLKIIQAKSHAFMKMRHKELKNIYEEADKLAHMKDIDQSMLDNIAKKRGQLSEKTIKHHVLLKHEIYHILDTKQRQKLQASMHNKKNE
ncbi:MAG: Spy/CpxP family protein refolding chaperone [Legionellaceae bacterium]|nr:Spy/CpxP family protein refolding chaperone [Legionellaceae bacterium]